MKNIYDAPTKSTAKAAMDDFAGKNGNTSTLTLLKAGETTGNSLLFFMKTLMEKSGNIPKTSCHSQQMKLL